MILIDADSILYKAGHAVEYTHYTLTKPCHTNKEFTTYVLFNKSTVDKHVLDGATLINTQNVIAPVENAIDILEGFIRKIKWHAGMESIRLYLSAPGDTWRHQIYRDYKANRDNIKKPTHLPILYEYVVNNFDTVTEDGLEADDLLCIDAHESLYNDDIIIAHIDKDLNQIPGNHLNYNSLELYSIDPIIAELNFYSQILTGDDGDNIPGIYGIGPKRAKKLLAECDTPQDMWRVVVDTYKDKCADLGIDDIILRGRLLRLLESRDYIWEP